MLRCCEDIAINRSLRFNSSKTQLIHFSRSPFSSCSARIYFCGQLLPFLDTVSHLATFFIMISMTLRMSTLNYVTW